MPSSENRSRLNESSIVLKLWSYDRTLTFAAVASRKRRHCSEQIAQYLAGGVPAPSIRIRLRGIQRQDIQKFQTGMSGHILHVSLFSASTIIEITKSMEASHGAQLGWLRKVKSKRAFWFECKTIPRLILLVVARRATCHKEVR